MPARTHAERWEEGDDERKKVGVGEAATRPAQEVGGKLALVCEGTDPDEIVDAFARTIRICYTTGSKSKVNQRIQFSGFFALQRGLTTFPGWRFERRQVDVSDAAQLKHFRRTWSLNFVAASSV
jgi:hypothetical protein